MSRDISHTLIADSSQINAIDLEAQPVTVTIQAVDVKESDQPMDIQTDAFPDRAYRPNLSMRRVMAKAWGTDADNWVGHSMTLYRDPDIKWAGVKTGGIRISAMTGLDRPLEMALQVSRGRFEAVRVEPLAAPQAPPEQPQAPLQAAQDLTEQIQAETDLDALRAMWFDVDDTQKAVIEARVNKLKAAQEPEEAAGE